MNSRRQFVFEGLKQAGLLFLSLLLVCLIARLLAWGSFSWFEAENRSGIRVAMFLVGMNATVYAASILCGPGPTLLTYFDISNQQIFILSCVLTIPYWACLGIIAGLIQQSNTDRELVQQRSLPAKQIRNRIRWTIGLAGFVIGVFFFLVGPIAGTNISDGRYSAGAYRNAIINNVRQLDGAKNEFILEKNPPTNYIVTEADLMPYIKLNSKGQIPRLGPERYVLNPLNQPVFAILDSDWRLPRRGWQEGFIFTNGTVF